MEQIAAHRLHHAVGDNEARAQPGRQQFCLPASFEEPKHQPKHHAERKSIQKQPDEIEGRRRQGKEQQGDFRGGNQPEQQRRPSLPRALGDDLDPQELRQHVTKNLGYDQDVQIAEAKKGRVVVFPRCERFAKRVHAEVGTECRHDRPDRLRQSSGTMCLGANIVNHAVVHEILGLNLLTTGHWPLTILQGRSPRTMRAEISSITGIRSAVVLIM